MSITLIERRRDEAAAKVRKALARRDAALRSLCRLQAKLEAAQKDMERCQRRLAKARGMEPLPASTPLIPPDARGLYAAEELLPAGTFAEALTKLGDEEEEE